MRHLKNDMLSLFAPIYLSTIMILHMIDISRLTCETRH